MEQATQRARDVSGSFDKLSWRGQLGILRRAAKRSLRAYGLAGSRLRLLKYEDNAIYKVLSPSGHDFVLRLAFEQSCTREELDSELRWLLALREETELDTPAPLHAGDGELATRIEVESGPPTLCCLLTWIPGRPLIGNRLTQNHLYQAGRATAHLHEHSRSWTPPLGFTRPSWDIDWLIGDLPGRLSKHESALGGEAVEVLGFACEKVAIGLGKLSKTPDSFGVVHADLNLENFLVSDRGVGVIDFDDCGWGYYIYDLATTISRLKREVPDENRRHRLQHALLSGYGRVRPLPDAFRELLPSFLAFRELVITTFILSSPNQRVHQWGLGRVRRAVETLKEHLMTTATNSSDASE